VATYIDDPPRMDPCIDPHAIHPSLCTIGISIHDPRMDPRIILTPYIHPCVPHMDPRMDGVLQAQAKGDSLLSVSSRREANNIKPFAIPLSKPSTAPTFRRKPPISEPLHGPTSRQQQATASSARSYKPSTASDSLLRAVVPHKHRSWHQLHASVFATFQRPDRGPQQHQTSLRNGPLWCNA
jgi:hypothetical protein